MSGHGSLPAKDKGDHPNRKVDSSTVSPSLFNTSTDPARMSAMARYLTGTATPRAGLRSAADDY